MSIGLRKWLSLSAATMVAQAAAIVVIPVLTRRYSPADFGVFSVYLSWIAPLAAVGMFGLDAIISSARSTYCLHVAVRMCWVAAGAVGVVGGILSWPWWARTNGHADSIALALLVVSGTLAMTFQVLYMSVAVREAMFKRIAGARLIITGAVPIVQLALLVLFSERPAFGLIIGHLACTAIAAWLLASAWRAGTSRDQLGGNVRVRWRSLFRHGARLIRHASPNAVGGILNQVSLSSLVLFAGLMYPASSVGHLSLAFRVYGILVALVGVTIAQTYMAGSSERRRNRVANEDQLALMKQWSLIAVPIAVTSGATVVIVGGSGFSLVFGAQWDETARMAALLTPYLFCELALIPFLQVLKVLGYLGHIMWGAILRVCALALVYGGGIVYEAKIDTVTALFSGVMLVTYGFQLAQVLTLLKRVRSIPRS